MFSTANHLAKRMYRNMRFRVLDPMQWKRRDYAAPSPVFVKRRGLERNSADHATWVETGTYLGETTAFLARHAKRVYSIEPEPQLFERARSRFAHMANVSVINATSESAFPSLLPTLEGAVNFWLDGHYSAGATFRGAVDTPIVEELAQIERHRDRFGALNVMIDDVRCFDPLLPEYAGYPPLDMLVDWARRNGLKWHIEHDIFVARSS